MDIVLICDLSEINPKWLRDIYNFIDKSTQIKVTIDYISSRIIINLINNKSDFMYIKHYSPPDLLYEIKKLNS